ncbi:MAG: beta-ketoacyl-[acyl-carrier-protein] synthase II, partial [Armatimonadetes bacterium]|nr:beta-ketoacyl-[acyl-carrier-protein] synthase II [Armatimonadota bacterium]
MAQETNLKKRVVITGLGVVSPVGVGVDAFWESVREGRSGISWITAFDASNLYCRIAGEVRDFDPTDYMKAADARKAGRFAHFAVAAAKLGVEDAALDLGKVDPFRIGVVMGTSVAGLAMVSEDIYS